MIYFLIFKYGPMFGVVIAFKDYNIFQGILASPWVGFDTFREVFQMDGFYRALRNTLLLNLLDLLISFPMPIILAILLNELRVKWFKKGAQMVLYLPHFISWIIIGGMAIQLLATNTGIVNNVLKSLGLQAIPFLTEPLYRVPLTWGSASGRARAGARSSISRRLRASTATCTRRPRWTAPTGCARCGTSRCQVSSQRLLSC